MTFRWLWLPLVVCPVLVTALGGCARSRVVTITTDPPDAIIRVDNRDRGRGPLTETFTFGGDTVAHTVTVRREGYNDKVVTITPESAEQLPIRLKPMARRITVKVKPADAVVKLDGQALLPDASGEIRKEVEFPLDAAGGWVMHVLTAEHPKYEPIERTLSYENPETEVTLDLAAVRKNLQIVTVPEGAEVYINDEFFGASPVTRDAFPFPVDEATGDHVKLTVRVEKPGFETRTETISWDDGRENYEWKLAPQSKLVRIITDPPDARVVLGNREVGERDETGAHIWRKLPFPIDAKGQTRPYELVVSMQTEDREWETSKTRINWDEGRTDYTIKLKEIVTRPVPMLRVNTARVDNVWTITGERATALAMRDTDEGEGAPAPEQVTRLPAGTMLDTVAVAPDGSQVLFTTLTMSDEPAGELRSQILAQPTHGSSEPIPLTDGQSLEITPAYTPDGSQVVFASNRAGRKLSIWAISVLRGGGGLEQLSAAGDANHLLWPSVDSSPRPRLFYQALVDTRSEPRLFSTQLGAVGLTDLTPGGGRQPRVGPNADAVVFAATSGPNGKRDIFRIPDGGGDAVNLTNTPDADEFDPAWSSDGFRIAYVSDATRTPEQPDNYDVFVLDVTQVGAEPVRVTANGSWDDSPAWDPRGGAIYFRSNRGGGWNVWRIGLN